MGETDTTDFEPELGFPIRVSFITTSGLEQVEEKKLHSGAKYTLINCEYFLRPSLNTCTSLQDWETVINKRVSLEKKLLRKNSLLNFWHWWHSVWQEPATSICCWSQSLLPGHCYEIVRPLPSKYKSNSQQLRWVNGSENSTGCAWITGQHHSLHPLFFFFFCTREFTCKT